MILRSVMLSLIVLALVSVAADCTVAATQNMSHPWLNASNYDGQAVWFAGVWHGAILLRVDVEKEQWESFYYSGIDLCCSRVPVVFEMDRIIFLGTHKNALVFEKTSKQWHILAPFDGEYYNGWSGLKKYKTIHFVHDMSEANLKRQTITVGDYEYIGLGSKIYKIKNHEVITSFELPTLSVQTLLRYRPKVREDFGYNESQYSFSDVVSGLEQNIGPMVLKAERKRIWFGIEFYNGEGMEGVGGVGFFDLKKEQFGILRPPILLDCSITQLEFEGDKLWILTNSQGERGNLRCAGLISYDTSNGEYSTYTVPLKPYSDLSNISFVKVGSFFWITTPQGIVEFDTKNNLWKVWAMNKVQIAQDTEVLSGIVVKDVLGPFIKLGQVAKGNVYDLWWAEISGGSGYFEIKTPFALTGWMSGAAYENLRRAERPGELALFTPLYADPDLMHPIGYYIAADFNVLENRQKQLKVSTQQGWIKSENALLMVGLLGRIAGGGITKDRWPSTAEDITANMLSTAEEEYVTASELEKQAKVIEDATCVIDASQDNYSFKPTCTLSTNKFANFWVNILNPVKAKTGTILGLPYIHMNFSTYGGTFLISPDGYDFWDRDKKVKSYETAQKGKRYEISNHRYKLIVEILDFKISSATTPPFSGLVFDWIKLRSKIIEYPSVK